MSVEQPPIQERSTDRSGRFPQTWIKWFQSISDFTKEGYSGSFTNGDGNTVTVVNGKITDVS